MEKLNTPDRFKHLASRWKDGSITSEETKEFAAWYNADQDKEIFIPEQFAKDLNSLNKSMFEAILLKIKPTKRVSLWPRIAAAAIIMVIFGAGIGYFRNIAQFNGIEQIADKGPGKNGAILTLANGKKIYISDKKTGVLANEPGISISKTADGQIIYTINDRESAFSSGFNTLQTSNGEQTQVRLPDGTVVYLNSASSLKYPTSFTKKKKRMVELSGEGYFNVNKDKLHPFIVKTERQEVEVLGTQFNINSYAGEILTRTTLLEGSIKITGKNKIIKVLKPNQQAINSATKMEIVDVEAQFFVDWKEGFFMFNKENLESIMKRVARWYNVKVIYEDPKLKSEIISGTISKYETISSLVNVLERSGLATFKIDKDVVTISLKK